MDSQITVNPNKKKKLRKYFWNVSVAFAVIKIMCAFLWILLMKATWLHIIYYFKLFKWTYGMFAFLKIWNNRLTSNTDWPYNLNVQERLFFKYSLKNSTTGTSNINTHVSKNRNTILLIEKRLHTVIEHVDKKIILFRWKKFAAGLKKPFRVAVCINLRCRTELQNENASGKLIIS